jgi:hypothetical protein
MRANLGSIAAILLVTNVFVGELLSDELEIIPA